MKISSQRRVLGWKLDVFKEFKTGMALKELSEKSEVLFMSKMRNPRYAQEATAGKVSSGVHFIQFED